MKTEGEVHKCRKCHGYYRIYSFTPQVATDCTKHDANNYVLKGEYDAQELHKKLTYGKQPKISS